MPRAISRIMKRIGDRESGMTTVEYAIGTLAAVAFAGVLLKVLTSDAVQAALSSIVQRALQ
jgi:Flp pilus assembly pilin Flp